MNQDISRVLFTEQEIKKRVEQLGKIISKEYVGKNLLLVGVLKGAVVFFADLMRNIDLPVEVDFICVSSYGAGTTSSGKIEMKKDISVDVSKYDVLIVEDILDTGLTLSYVKDLFSERNAKSVAICTLLDKRQRRKVKIDAEYVGFVIPDEFIVGYGLDYNQAYRNIPYIGVLDEKIYSNAYVLTAKKRSESV